MKLTKAQTTLLRTALRGRSQAELRAVFKIVRAHETRDLLAALAPPKKRAAKRQVDPLVRDLEQTLKPILGPAAEKAELLVEHIAKKHRRKLGLQPKGLADAARQLRANFSDTQISAAAKSLVTHLNDLYGDRDTVV